MPKAVLFSGGFFLRYERDRTGIVKHPAKAISCGGNETQHPISWETSAVLFQDQYSDGHVSEGPGPPQPAFLL